MKTAVEWLVEQFDLEMQDDFHLTKIEQAKEMEMHQIINSYNIGFITPIEFDFNTGKSVTAEQYYNETYKK
jgi:hypothetical protein